MTGAEPVGSGAVVHAGCVARRQDGGWSGVLLTGRPGAGKSDLMLRLVERGWSLVADDRVKLWSADGAVYGRAPETLAGLIEVRGVDVARLHRRDLARLGLVVACLSGETPLERLPEPRTETLAGVVLPRFALHALEASAPAKVELALAQTGRRFDSGAGRTI